MTTPTLPSRPGPTRRELEASLETYFQHQVRLRGGMVEKLISTRRGIPDRMVLFPGGAIYLVELKAWCGRTSALQAVWHARAASLGTNVVVLEGRDAVDAWLRSLFGDWDRAREAATPRAALRRASSTRARARRKLAEGKPLTAAEREALMAAGEL